MSRSVRATLLMSALAATSSVSAQAPPAAVAQPLPRTAFIAAMDAEYGKIDANKDGRVVQAEVELQQRRILEAAAAVTAQTTFSRMDADRNGQLSLEEFTRATARAGTSPDVALLMKRLDANGDRLVTLVEYRTLTLGTFDRIDADKDGVLSPAEQRSGGFAR